ncbi:tetratricopeptide repeat protein [Candidatus Saccharibacteria bacterium]|nr:tetratricopeptide repeat protein [Candidatus Saccharibacteria bacterium]
MRESWIPQKRRIKILLLAANPTDSTRLRIDEEFRAIDRALRETKFRDYFEMEPHWAVRFSDLPGLLMRHQPNIVHFSGHGSNSNEIIVEDDTGKSHPISARALSNLFLRLKDNIRCVVLNACFSTSQAKAIAKHIDVVIGMSNAIGDQAAIQFSSAFYLALGYGRNLTTAFELGCTQIDLSNLNEQDTPQLLAQNRDPAKIIFVTTSSRDQVYFSEDTRVPLDAALYTEATVVAAPDKIFGRRDLMLTVGKALNDKKQVLLTGLGGIGKTALAGAIANQHIREDGGTVVWIRCGNEKAETLLEALVTQATTSGISIQEPEIKSVAGDAKIKAVREIITHSAITLIVFDDIRNGMTLREVQKAVPNNIQLLVTSRRHFPSLARIEVGDLAPEEALNLLSYYAGKQIDPKDPHALALCKTVGYHPYALEIAGAILNIDEKTPAQLLRRIGDTPHTFIFPDADFDEAHGRTEPSSIKTLLDDSFQALDDETALVFCAFGALFAPGATAALLSFCTERSLDSVETALDNLARRSLAKRRASTDYYSVHDLTFSYAREKFRQNATTYQTNVVAVENFVVAHAQDFAYLELDQPNILGAAKLASGESLLRIVSTLAIGGYPNAYSPSYFDAKGHTLEFLDRLDQAIEAAKQTDLTQFGTLHYLLCKQGGAYVDRGKLDKALEAYRLALDLAPTEGRRALTFAVCGRVLAMQGNFPEAEQFLEQGYAVATRKKDDNALAYVLQQQSFIAGELKKDYEAAQRFAVEAVETNRRLNNQIALGFSLINLGSAELDLAIEKALAHYQEALSLARLYENGDLLAFAMEAIGRDYHANFDFEHAQTCFVQAIDLYHRAGKVEAETKLRTLMFKYGYLEPGEAQPGESKQVFSIRGGGVL